MIVIDTHVLIWAVQGDAKLGREASMVIEHTGNEEVILVPAICAWEVAMVEQKGTVGFPGGALHWMRKVLDSPAFRLAPLEPGIAIDSVRLEWAHKDPADRIIVATARYWKVPLLTADEKILRYAAAGHLTALDARV